MGTFPPEIAMPYYELDVNFNNSGGSTTVYVQGGTSDASSLVTAVFDAIAGLSSVASVSSNSWGETELSSYTAPIVVFSPALSPSFTDIAQGASDQFNITLSSAPTENTTVNVVITDTLDEYSMASYVTASPSSLTFTPENWNTAQQVTLSVANPAHNPQTNQSYVSVVFEISGLTTGPSTTVTWTN